MNTLQGDHRITQSNAVHHHDQIRRHKRQPRNIFLPSNPHLGNDVTTLFVPLGLVTIRTLSSIGFPATAPAPLQPCFRIRNVVSQVTIWANGWRNFLVNCFIPCCICCCNRIISKNAVRDFPIRYALSMSHHMLRCGFSCFWIDPRPIQASTSRRCFRRQTQRINPAGRIRRVLEDVDATRQPDRILRHVPSRRRIVVPMPVVMQPRLIVMMT